STSTEPCRLRKPSIFSCSAVAIQLRSPAMEYGPFSERERLTRHRFPGVQGSGYCCFGRSTYAGGLHRLHGSSPLRLTVQRSPRRNNLLNNSYRHQRGSPEKPDNASPVSAATSSTAALYAPPKASTEYSRSVSYS